MPAPSSPPHPATRKGIPLPVVQTLLAAALAKHGLTVTVLALRLGTSRQHASKLLRGQAPLTVPLAERLAPILDMAADELLDLRHDGVSATTPTEAIPLLPVRILADPTAPIEDWTGP